MAKYLKAGNMLYSTETVCRIDCSEIENLIVKLHLISGSVVEIKGLDAIEIAMSAKPSVIEGKRFAFRKGAWIIHNIFGHPVMQLFALFHLYKIAIWIHEITIPKPRGIYEKSLERQD